jgi:hypothetical protein
MVSCPTCQMVLPDEAGTCTRCGASVAGSPVMLTMAVTPEDAPGVARFDSRFPFGPARAPVTPPPARPFAAVPAGGSAAALTAVTPVTPPPAPAVIVKLRVIRGLRANAEYPVYVGRNVIGRFADRPVDIDLTGVEPDGQVWSSRRHAAVTLDNGLLVLEDLNSLNGTWVNGARIRAGGAFTLKAGDVIQIGVTQLRVEVEAAPTPT